MNLYKEEQNLLRLERELAAKEAKQLAARKLEHERTRSRIEQYAVRSQTRKEMLASEEERHQRYLASPQGQWALFAANYVATPTRLMQRKAADLANESQLMPRPAWRRRSKYMGRHRVGIDTRRCNAAGKMIGGHSGLKCGNAAFNEDRWIGRRYDAVRSNERERLARLAADDCMDDMVDYDPMSELVEYLDEGAGWCYYRSYDEVGGDDFLRSGDARPYWDQCPKRLKRCEGWLTDVEESDYYATKAGCQATDLEHEIAEKQMVLDKLVKERDYYDARMKKLYGRQ